MDKKTSINFWYVLATIFGVLILQNLWTGYQDNGACAV